VVKRPNFYGPWYPRVPNALVALTYKFIKKKNPRGRRLRLIKSWPPTRNSDVASRPMKRHIASNKIVILGGGTAGLDDRAAAFSQSR